MMVSRAMQIEPFIERIGQACGAVGPSIYRFGYRLEATAEILSVVDIPADVVEQVLNSKLSLSIRLTPEGEVAVFATIDETSIVSPAQGTSESIDVLVSRVVGPENLQFEEAGVTELTTLLTRLEHSVSLVRNALTQLQNGVAMPHSTEISGSVLLSQRNR
jgi:hypothetical protein